MNRKSLWLISITILLLVIAVACEVSFSRKDEGPSEEEIAFELTRVSIEKTQTAIAQASPEPEESPSPESTEEEDEDEDDDEPTATPLPCNDPDFQSETIPDDTKFDPGDTFTKTWTVKNEGTCTWNTNYKFVFVTGDKMNGASSTNLTKNVKPGENYTFSVDLKAPASDGVYQGYWKIQADDGEQFGNYWVKIIVGTPPSAFAVTSVNYSGYDAVVDIVCPSNEVVNITANITANGAGTVSFKWDDSAGCPGCATKSIKFNSAGTKTVTHSMIVPAGGDYWARIYIDEPNHQWFHKAEFEAHCNP